MMAGRWKMAVRDERGQATLEYAFVLMAFLALLMGLAAMWHAARDGRLLRLAVEAAPNAITEGGEVGAVQDILSY